MDPSTGTTLNDTLGAILLGAFFAAMYAPSLFSLDRTLLTPITYSLYGIMCVQCYVFFQRFSQEGKPLKYAVRTVS
jgi:hypothetical protein